MRKARSTTSLSTWLLAGLFVTTAGAADAQTARPAVGVLLPGEGGQGSGPNEIIVTAQKRAENLQQVPQAVQVLSGALLEAASVREFTDLTKVSPSLVVRPAEHPANASVSVRGIGTFAFSIGVEPSVAVQMDDVPVAFQARAFADLSDIERIEVLRGPQSTLYGKSASAGLINIVTKAPSKTMTAKVNAMITTDDEYSVGGTVSGPINDKIGFRITANHDDFDGNVHNLTTGDKVNGRKISSVRGKLVVDPTDNLSVTLGLNYLDGSQSIGRPFIGLSPTAYLRGNTAQPPSVFQPGVTFGPDNRDVANNFTSGTDYTAFGQSLKVEWDLGGPTLVSVSSHDRYRLTDVLDQDETSVATPDNRQTGKFESTQKTQELRLVSPGGGPLRYTLGLYYADVDYTRDFTRGPFFAQARWYGTSGSKQEAAFGQVEWKFLAHTTAIAGLRYQHEKIKYTFRDIAANNAFFSGGATDNFATYRLGLQQEITPDLMLYGSYSTGHKGQAYDLSTGFNSNRALAGPIRPEKSGSWELGARSQFLDRRVTVNATLFNAKYRDFQAQGIETLADGTVNYRLTNVGRLRTRGLEVDSSALVTENFKVGVSGTYLDAVIRDFPFAQCYAGQTAAQGCTGSPARQNLAGQTPPQTPKWKLSANAEYSHAVPTTPFEIVLQGQYSYQSRINFSLNQDPQTVQGSYGVMNLSAGIRDPDGRYEIMAFVNNVFDQRYYVNLYNSTGNYNNQLATQALLPRDVRRFAGVRASYSF